MLLHPDQTPVQGFSAGTLGLLNLSSLEIGPAPNDLTEVRRIEPQKSRFWELGYTGIIGGERASLRRCVLCPKEEFCWWTADVYPFCSGARPETDLTIDLAAVITSNEDLISLLDLLDAVSG